MKQLDHEREPLETRETEVLDELVRADAAIQAPRSRRRMARGCCHRLEDPTVS